MAISDAQKRAIKKYRQGKGLEIAREISRRGNATRDTFTEFRHMKVEKLFTEEKEVEIVHKNSNNGNATRDAFTKLRRMKVEKLFT